MANNVKNIPREDDIHLEAAFDDTKQAIRTTGDVSISGGDLDIDAATDSIAIGDPITGKKAIVTANNELLVNINGGAVSTPPPTNFASRTYTVSNTPTAISIPGFSITSVAIKALGTNLGYVRIGKSDVLSSSTNFYLLSPSESLNIPLAASDEPLYYVKDPDSPAGTYVITLMVVN
jgi:hypothetical protein